MTEFMVAIGLKIPDNTAQTALVTLRRLGVEVAHAERNDIWRIDGEDAAGAIARVQSDETLFNPNTHRLLLLDAAGPRAGEAWIATLPPPGASEPRPRHYVGWRLFEREGRPAGHTTLVAAVERLLCNPAIERASLPD